MSRRRPPRPAPEPEHLPICELTEAITSLSLQTNALTRWFRSNLNSATKQDLEKLGEYMATKIEEFGAVVEEAFNKVGTAVDGISGDVTELKRKVDELQNSVGGITPGDQVLLDAIQARATTLVERVEALDALTENVPTPPVA